jgi:hypothetical protein
MATTTPNFGWPVPTSSDLVKNGATAIEGLGDAIDASLLDLKGGTTGQVLAKASNTDMDFSWVVQDDVNAIQNTQLTAKGALISAVSAGTPVTLTVGSNDQVLTADSTTASGLKWATPAAGGGGKILQVVNFSTTTASTKTGTTYSDTNITATITPTSATSKILILSAVACQMYTTGAYNQVGMGLRILRGATDIYNTGIEGWYFTNVTTTYHQLSTLQTINYIDNPSTTSATTYKIQFSGSYSGANIATSDNSRPSTMILMEVGA